MTIVLQAILTAYLFLVLVLIAGWRRLLNRPVTGKGKVKTGITVIVPCRNEEGRISGLIESLTRMQYPSEKFEVLLVDDHSSDRTVQIIHQLIGSHPNFRMLRLPDQQIGKKSALKFGIAESHNELIATTDADCTVPADWLSYISLYFEEEKTHLVAGPVVLDDKKSFFAKLQASEFVSLTGSTASAIGLGHPIMCNGANLSFRKKSFEEVGGYNDNLHIASGDDEFLMRKIAARYPGSIAFMGFQEASVRSQTQATLGEFVSQRLRWAGKWKHQPDWLTRVLAAFIVVSQLTFISLAVMNAFHPLLLWSILLGLKMGLELIYLGMVTLFFHKRLNVTTFLTLQLSYPLYVTIMGILSLFVPYSWKDRNYK